MLKTFIFLQINREFKVMKALSMKNFPVPRMIHYCENPKVIGTEFYLMEYLPVCHVSSCILF